MSEPKCKHCGDDLEICTCKECETCGGVDDIQSNDNCESCNDEQKELESTYSNSGRHE